MSSKTIILASTSPRRAHLMQEAQLEFQVIPPEAREIYSRQYSPRELAMHNSMLKCRSVARNYPQHIVIGADTVVTVNGSAIGKPRDEADAEAMLAGLSGKAHEVVSGVTVMHLSSQHRASFMEISRVTLRELNREAILAYHQRIGPLDKAGAYAAQEDEGEVIESIDGSISNVIGLPMERLVEVLKAF